MVDPDKKQDLVSLMDLLNRFNSIGETEQGKYTWEVNGTTSVVNPGDLLAVQHIITYKDEVNHASISEINRAFGFKLSLLNDAIKKLGYSDIDLTSKDWGYDVVLAGNNNAKGLGNLKCEDYPGVILPAGVCKMPSN
jgi:hypothetical protein